MSRSLEDETQRVCAEVRGTSISSVLHRLHSNSKALFMYLYLHLCRPQGSLKWSQSPIKLKPEVMSSPLVKAVLSRADKTAGSKPPLLQFSATRSCMHSVG